MRRYIGKLLLLLCALVLTWSSAWSAGDLYLKRVVFSWESATNRAALDTFVSALILNRREAAQPQPHQFQLVPAA
jgi:drug/metabolite transporter (DMT)-like permease